MKPPNVCALVGALLIASAAVATQADETVFTAVSANVAAPGDPVKIRIQSWSTPEQAAPLIAALNPPPAPARGAGSDDGRASGRGDLAGRGGRAGGRGRGRGAAPAAPLSPTAALSQAIGRAPTIGYLWTSGVTGYAIKYAYRASLPDRGERVIVATDRRLGAYAAAWRPTSSDLTDYEFTVIEIHFDAKGVGEGKTSLTTRVMVDREAKTVALENYAAAAPILRNVKRS